MSGKHESSMPQEIRSSLRVEPPEKQRAIERVWSLLGEVDENEAVVPSTDEAWNALENRVETSVFANRGARDRRALRTRRAIAATAVTAAVVLVLGFLWMLRPATVSTAAGEQRLVQLPDGSTVELNSASSLRYARWSFLARSSRRTTLEGEAFFSVEPSPVAFVVETNEARIEVLGTEFNVRARRGPAEDGTLVTLASGRVRLSSRLDALGDSVRAVTLTKAGQSARISVERGAPRIEPALAGTLDHVLAWRQSGFAVVDRPLQSVLDELERRYAVEVAPRKGVDLTEPMNLFYLRGAVPEQIVRDICLAQACSYRETSRGFALSARDTTSAVETSRNGGAE